MPPTADNAEPHVRISRDYVDWAVKGIIGGLCVGLGAVALWGFNTEARVATTEKFEIRISALEGKEDGYQKLRTDIEVVKTKLENQDEQLDRIEQLIVRQP